MKLLLPHSATKRKFMSVQTIARNPFLRPLSNRNFRLLWVGGSVSVLGSQFSLIALPWLVLQLTSDPQALGLVLAMAGLPRALFMLFGGVITDRFSARKILLLCDWLNFVLAGIVAALVFDGSLQVWMVYIYSFISGAIAGIVLPAANSITPQLLPGRDLQAGNSITMGTSQLMGFIGPALAGVIIGSSSHSLIGVALAFAFDSLTFAFSAVTLGLMHGIAREKMPAHEQASAGSAWSSIVVAIRYIMGKDAMRLMFLVLIFVNLLSTGPLLVGIPVLAHQRLAEGAAAFGLLMSAYAGGNLLGFVLAGGLPRPGGSLLRWIILFSVALFGIVVASFGWILSTWLDFFLVLALGVGNGYVGLVLFTWIQRSTPREMLGRVMSLFILSSLGLVPLSQAVSGAVIKWDLTAMFALAGGLLVLVAAWLAFQPGLRSLSDQMLEGTAAD
jgi:MFS family permease